MRIADYRQFSDIDISHGSVATNVRCSGIFKHNFVVNLPLSPPVKEFRKSVNICYVLVFLTYSVYEYKTYNLFKYIIVTLSHFLQILPTTIHNTHTPV